MGRPKTLRAAPPRAPARPARTGTHHRRRARGRSHRTASDRRGRAHFDDPKRPRGQHRRSRQFFDRTFLSRAERSAMPSPQASRRRGTRRPSSPSTWSFVTPWCLPSFANDRSAPCGGRNHRHSVRRAGPGRLCESRTPAGRPQERASSPRLARLRALSFSAEVNILIQRRLEAASKIRVPRDDALILGSQTRDRSQAAASPMQGAATEDWAAR